MIKNCQTCGKEFTPNHSNQKYCSRDCSNKRLNKIEITCPICNKIFVTPNKDRKYCSIECGAIGRKRKDPLPERKCEICGETFTLPNYNVNQKYCSQKCAGIAKRKEKTIKICPTCGEKFVLGSNPHQKYCSRTCGDKGRKGNSHPQYWKKRQQNQSLSSTRVCIICGNEFTLPNKSSNQKYCSRKCAGIGRKKTHIHKTSKKIIICKTCGEEFQVWPYRKNVQFCSRECKHDFGRVEKTCLGCNKKYIITKWEYKLGFPQKFCQECREGFNKTIMSAFEQDVKNKLLDENIEIETNICIKTPNIRIYPDIKIGNIIVECQGDYWHCNPNIYEKDHINSHTLQTAKEIWEKDKKREQILLAKGFKVIYIWEDNWHKEYKEIIKKIKQEIKNEISKN